MEFLFEILIDLILEGSIEISKSKKIPKYIRYPLILFVSLFFISVIAIVFLTSILSFKINILVGLFFLSLAIFMLIMSIRKFKKIYIERKK